jgi:cell growth-regulating nucleolar protein
MSLFDLFSSRDSYKEHTKCVSEQEKYGGANYSAPTNINKGEKKQNQWFEIVQSAINLNTGSNQAKILLKKLQYYPNTPRKRAKFIVSRFCSFELFMIFINRILLITPSKVFHLE